jgi:hypothetical protein
MKSTCKKAIHRRVDGSMQNGRRFDIKSDTPSGESNGAGSLLSDPNSMPRARIILASSRVVTTASTSPAPLGRRASSFFAVHGITDTRYGGMAVGGQGITEA